MNFRNKCYKFAKDDLFILQFKPVIHMFRILKSVVMKKVVLVTVSLIFVLALLVSCNKSICPAYASQADTEQVEPNS